MVAVLSIFWLLYK